MTSAETSRLRRAYLRGRNRCERCGAQDARTLIGKPMCFECLGKKLAYERDVYQRYASKIRQRQKALRENRKAAGLCPRCGAPMPSDTGKITCKSCRVKACAREAERRRIAGIPTLAELIETGLCVTCGKPVKIGYNSGNQPIKLCESCYEKSLISLEKARRTQKENGPNFWQERQKLFYGAMQGR